MLYRKSCKDRAPILACPSVSSALSVLHCHGTFVTIKESALLLTVNSTLLQLLRKNIWIYFAKIEIAELRGDRLASFLSHLLVFHRIFLGTGNHMYTHADPFYFMACLFFFILLYLERFSASMCLNLLHCFFFFFNGQHTLFCALLKCNTSYLFPDFKSSRKKVRSGTPPFYLTLEVRDHLPAFVE